MSITDIYLYVSLKCPLMLITIQGSLPFHCQYGQHLWLQDLPPTMELLQDPLERQPVTRKEDTAL